MILEKNKAVPSGFGRAGPSTLFKLKITSQEIRSMIDVRHFVLRILRQNSVVGPRNIADNRATSVFNRLSRTNRLNIFWDDRDDPDDHMETRLNYVDPTTQTQCGYIINFKLFKGVCTRLNKSTKLKKGNSN